MCTGCAVKWRTSSEEHYKEWEKIVQNEQNKPETLCVLCCFITFRNETKQEYAPSAYSDF